MYMHLCKLFYWNLFMSCFYVEQYRHWVSTLQWLMVYPVVTLHLCWLEEVHLPQLISTIGHHSCWWVVEFLIMIKHSLVLDITFVPYAAGVPMCRLYTDDLFWTFQKFLFGTYILFSHYEVNVSQWIYCLWLEIIFNVWEGLLIF